MEKKIRKASHSDSWYEGNEKNLRHQLDHFLQNAKLTDLSTRAVISPHAGYSYSGQSAAYAYKNLDRTKIKRIFILGPSHHVYTTKCALSKMDEYATPIGNIKIDKSVNEDLNASGLFEWMTKAIDEDEHSIEMQLPYISKVMGDSIFTLVPILVGSLSKDAEEKYGELISKYLEDQCNFFIISSDFCHWGKRFNYTYHDSNDIPIYKSIESLDHQGMDYIESQDIDNWYAYLKKYKNTICGRHPIGVFLHALRKSSLSHKIKFVYYSQSNQCTSNADSSVSYAVAVAIRI